MTTQTVQNINLRHFDDSIAHALVDMFAESSLHLLGINDANYDELMHEWHQSPGFDVNNDIRVAETADGKIIGYADLWDTMPPYVKKYSWVELHPAYWDDDLAHRLFDWVETHARSRIALCPDDAQVVLNQSFFYKHDLLHRVCKQRGYTHARSFYRMQIEFNEAPQPVLPKNGINIRALNFEDPQEKQAAFIATEEAFKDHWGHIEVSAEETGKKWEKIIQENFLFDPTLWFIALDGDKIAGMVYCNPKIMEDEDCGWISTLGVCKPWRRNGLGLALLNHAFVQLHRRGAKRAALGVDASSLTGATRLYENAGMKVVRQYDAYELVLRAGKDLSTQTLQQET